MTIGVQRDDPKGFSALIWVHCNSRWRLLTTTPRFPTTFPAISQMKYWIMYIFHQSNSFKNNKKLPKSVGTHMLSFISPDKNSSVKFDLLFAVSDIEKSWDKRQLTIDGNYNLRIVNYLIWSLKLSFFHFRACHYTVCTLYCTYCTLISVCSSTAVLCYAVKSIDYSGVQVCAM